MRKTAVKPKLPVAVARGAGMGFAVIAVLFAAEAGLVLSGKLASELMGTLVLATAALGAITGGIVGARSLGERRLIVGIIVGAAMMIFCILISMIAAPKTPNLQHAAIAAALSGGGALGGVLSATKKRKKR